MSAMKGWKEPLQDPHKSNLWPDGVPQIVAVVLGIQHWVELDSLGDGVLVTN